MQASRVVFIAGDGRSGGTLLGQILDGLSDSVYIGELKNIWHESFEQNEPCGCGERFRNCEFWRAVVEKTFGSFERLDLRAMLEYAQVSGSGALYTDANAFEPGPGGIARK